MVVNFATKWKASTSRLDQIQSQDEVVIWCDEVCSCQKWRTRKINRSYSSKTSKFLVTYIHISGMFQRIHLNRNPFHRKKPLLIIKASNPTIIANQPTQSFPDIVGLVIYYRNLHSSSKPQYQSAWPKEAAPASDTNCVRVIEQSMGGLIHVKSLTGPWFLSPPSHALLDTPFKSSQLCGAKNHARLSTHAAPGSPFDFPTKVTHWLKGGEWDA